MLEAEKNNDKNNESYIFQNNTTGDTEELKNITLRKDGRYMINYQYNGNRIYGYAHTQKQATEKLKQLKKKALTYSKQKINYLFSEWNSYWLETYKKPFMQLKNYNDLKFLINEINQNLGNIYLNKLTSIQIQEYYNTYKQSRKKEKIILYINASLQKALENNLINVNPTKAVVKDKKLKFNKGPFNIDEQETILNAIKGTDIECYILLYLLTGIRKNELNNNVTEWLNTETNQIKACNEKQKSNITEYKIIDISPNYTKLLIQQKDKFILTPDTVYRKFKELLKNLDIQGDLHKLRHTFATNYYYLGIPDKIISAWLGHSTTLVTKNVYIGIERKNFIERLNKLYNNLLFKF